MGDVAISVERLGKQYRIGKREPFKSIRETIAGGMAGAFRRQPAASAREDTNFWALSDISFEVKRGEVLGVIGRNGAGKSTLLKVLSRVTEPTTGVIDIYGRVGSLLEVGTGFHAELSGRENIYLNGAILGMPRAEIQRKFDEIVAFAEVDRFVDTPVKHYSSGMYMRLAFSVAAHLEPEIMVVDEVLSVGDAQFQKKCLGKMDDVAREGRTVFFVSHNTAAIRRLCTRAILLDQGQLVASGAVADIVAQYSAATESDQLAGFDARLRSGQGWAHVTDIRLIDREQHSVSALPCDVDLELELDLSVTNPGEGDLTLRGLVLELAFKSEQGQPILSLMNVDEPGFELPGDQQCTVRMRLPGPTFVPGVYYIDTFLGVPFIQHVDEVREALRFEILSPEMPWRPYELYLSRGIVCRKAMWSGSVSDRGRQVVTPGGKA